MEKGEISSSLLSSIRNIKTKKKTLSKSALCQESESKKPVPIPIFLVL